MIELLKNCFLFTVINSLHGAESFLRSTQVLSCSRHSPHFMERDSSLPHSQEPATCLCTERSVRFQGLCVICNMFKFFRWGVVSTSPNPQLEDHPLLAVSDCLFNMFAATLHNWRPLLHPQPEDAPCRGDRDPLVTVSVYYRYINACHRYPNKSLRCVFVLASENNYLTFYTT